MPTIIYIIINEKKKSSSKRNKKCTKKKKKKNQRDKTIFINLISSTLTMFRTGRSLWSPFCEDLVPYSSCFSSSYQDQWPAK